jgi:hypothetical protein
LQGKADNDPSPHSIGELLLDEVNIIQQFKIADAASHDAFYFFKHPQDLLLPQVIIEDGALRIAHGVGDVVATPFHMVSDLADAGKHGTTAIKDLLDAPLDLLKLDPVQSVKDVGDAVVNVAEGVGDIAKAAVVEPVKGVVNTIKDLFF